VLSPAGARARLSVLIFHRVHPQADPLFPTEVDARGFDEMLGWIGALFKVLPLDAAVQALREGRLPARAAAITFDDGYADNEEVALPILQRHRMPATFFIATGFLDGGRMWNDTIVESLRLCPDAALDLQPLGLGLHPLPDWPARRAAVLAIIRQVKYRPVAERLALVREISERARVQPSDRLMMRSEQVRSLRSAGMQIGAHTVSHPILARTDAAEARAEIAESRDRLQALLGERVSLFAYPNGRAGTDYLPEHARLARELGFDAAVTTDWGAAGAATDPHRLPRFTPWDRSRGRFCARMLRNLMQGRGPVTAS
jgi:peptidoglycan/xylan/chitin deacetylase (PgdA/CDA1 family)